MGVSTRLLRKEKRALCTHSYGHSLNLAVHDTVKANVILCYAMDTIEEISKSLRSDKLYLKK